MGNESSTEKEDVNTSKIKRAGGLRRSNSLKDNQSKQRTASATTKEKTTPNKGTIRRSHTFSPSSMKRPTFLKFDNTSKINKLQRSINKDEVDNIDLNGNKSLSKIQGKLSEDISKFENTQKTNIQPIAEEQTLDSPIENVTDMSLNAEDNATITNDIEIITPNKSDNNIENANTLDNNVNKNNVDLDKQKQREKSVDSKMQSVVESFHITEPDIIVSPTETSHDKSDDDELKMVKKSNSSESLGKASKYLNVSCNEILRSVDETDKNINKSDNEKEAVHYSKKNRPPDLPLEDKKRTITRRKNRYVRRSQSMKSYHELLPKLLSDDGFASISEISKAIEERDAEAGLAYKQKLNRRISDTCLVKEEHVRRSEQFSQMLNDLREKALRDIKPLSPYAKEFISEQHSKESGVQSPERKFKFEKSRGYFDFWLKDHNDRIESLTKALEGDLEMRNLKETFNERCLMVPSKLLLPARPHSVKLPRRRFKTTPDYRIPSDSSDNEQNSSIENINAREIPTPDIFRSETKESRDTKIKIRSRKTNSMISIRSSNEKLDNGTKSEIRFSNGSLRSRSKIAVVKPIQRTGTDLNNNELLECVK